MLGGHVRAVLLPALLLPIPLLGACDGETPVGGFPRTRLLVAGPAALVGVEGTSCSSGAAGAGVTPERWCGIYRTRADGGGTELLALDVGRAAASEATHIPCDGGSPLCRRIHDRLWTGEPIFSPSHPFIHGFDGDTLVFYADSVTTGRDDGFQGPVRAWRPELAGPRQLTGPTGVACVGQAASAGALCIENQRQEGGLIEMDVLAGLVDQAAPVGPGLPFLDRVRPLDADGNLFWQIAFSPDGRWLAYSDMAPEAPVERLRVVETAQVGVTPAREILRDVARWQFAPDGRRIYYLQGFQHDLEDGMGTLSAADFPQGTNPVALAPRVGRFDAHGPPGGPATSIAFFQDLADLQGDFRVMPDISRPGEVATVARQVEDVRVSPDRRFSIFHRVDDRGEITSMLARNDGSGTCVLNFKRNHMAFGTTFASVGSSVFWAEDSEGDSTVNEAYVGDAQGCMGKRMFASRISYLEATRSGVLFGKDEGGNLSMSLHHGRMEGGEFRAYDIGKQADMTVAVIDQRWIVFTVNRAEPDQQGVYLHGPLPD